MDGAVPESKHIRKRERNVFIEFYSTLVQDATIIHSHTRVSFGSEKGNTQLKRVLG